MGIFAKLKSYFHCFIRRRPRNMFKRPWIHCNQLVEAIETNDIVAAEKVLDAGFDVDSVLLMGKRAIVLCIERQRTEMAKLLINRGCSLSLTTWNGQSPLHLAAAKGDLATVKLLVENRADVSSHDLLGQTPLHVACGMLSLEIVKYLIEKGSNVHKKDRDSKTPLIIACAGGSVSVASYLISKGSDVNSSDCCGNSPLLHAVESNNCSEALIKCLINAGSKINYKNHSGETALLKILHRSGTYEQSDEKFNRIYEILIDAGSDVNAKNLLDQNPLHIAIAINNEFLVRKLLNTHCDPNAIDRMGYVPLFYACRDEKENLVMLLMEGGAYLNTQNWLHCKTLLKAHQSSRLFDYVIEKSQECPKLVDICKDVIRRNLNTNIEKGVSYLTLPTSLMNYITLQPTQCHTMYLEY